MQTWNVFRKRRESTVKPIPFSGAPTSDFQTGILFVDNHRAVFIVTLVILTSLFSLLFINKSNASLATFYPTACSGTWEDSQNAIGAPSLLEGATADQYTISNSAVLGKTRGDITCGQFEGAIPESVDARKFRVRFHLSIDTGSVVHDVVPPQEETPVPTEPIPVTETPAPVEVVSPVVEVPAPTEEPSAPVEVPPVVEIPTPTETPVEPIPETNSVDVIQIPAGGDIPEVLPPAPPSEIQASLNIFSALALGTSSSDVAQFSRPEFLEARYTIDGEHWTTIGSITTANWQNIELPINNSELADWTDLSKLQIGLFSLDGTEAPASVYLDALEVNVYYSSQEESALPVVKVEDPASPIIITSKKDYTLDESPTFTIDSSGLTTESIGNMIRDQKAEVIKDDMKVFGETVTATEEVSATEEIPVTETVSEFGAFVAGSQITNLIFEQLAFLYKYVLTHAHASLMAFVGSSASPLVDAVVLSSTGDMTTIPVSVERVAVNGVDTSRIVVAKPERMFRPGMYTLQVTVHTGEVTIISEQDFTWGVLALNVDKSIYNFGDDAYVQMGVLTNYGHTVCDAGLFLTITTPEQVEKKFTTADGTILKPENCRPDAYSDTPDYYVHYRIPKDAGTYTLVLTATTENGTRSMVDAFEVRESSAFDVRRVAPTRIYPVDSYPVSAYITPTADWTGTITERVPAVFEITEPTNSQVYQSVVIKGEEKIISWQVSLRKGEETVLGYYFTAPRISPEFYLIGPLSFYEAETNNLVFQELRQWQIADDAVCTAVLSGTWNANNTGSMWSGCSGVSGVPAAADDVTINSGVTITLGAATPVVNSLTIAGTLTTSLSNYSLSSKVITVNLGGTLTANGSTITISGTTNSIFSVAGTFNKGTSTVSLTGGSTATTLPAVSYYSLTLNNASNTYLLTGTTSIDPAGTLAVTSGTFSTSVSNYALSAGHISTTSNASSITTLNGSTVTITGTTGTLFAKGAASVLNANSSTVIMNPDAAVTLFSGAVTLNNLTLSPTLTTDRTYSVSGGAITINGDFNINPSGLGQLSVNMTAGVTTFALPATKTFTLQRTGSATVLLNTSTSGQSISTGILDIEAGATLTANQSTITLTGTSGTPFVMNGTFNAGSSTVTYNGNNVAGNTTIASTPTYYNLTISNASETYVLNGPTTTSAAGTINVNLGTLDTTVSNYALTAGKMSIPSNVASIFLANGSTITLNGTSGTLLTRGNVGTFTAGTSTVVMNPDAAVTLFSGTATFNNLTLSPVLTTSRTYSCSGGAMTINGDFNITPSGTGLLTVNMTASVTTFTVAASKTMLLQPTGSATVLLNTSTSGQSISTGILDIEAGATLTANQSTITLTGTSGTPFVMNGTFNAGSSTVTYNGNNVAGNTTIASTPTYYNLTISNASETYVLNGPTTTSAAGTINVNLGTLDTTASNYALTTGKLVISSNVASIFVANGSTITLNSSSGGTMLNKGASGTFTAGTSTVVFAADSAATLFAAPGTLNNVTIAPVLTTSRTYSCSGGAMTINGDFNITPSGTGLLTVNMTSSVTTFTVAASKTMLLQPTGGATVLLDTIASTGAISTGILDIESGATLTVSGGSTITLTGTSGTPFIMNGTFNGGTGTVTYNGNNPGGNTTIASTPTYGSLTVSNASETYVFGGNITAAVTGTTTVTSGTLNTTASNYSLTTGKFSLANSASAIFIANASTITLTATTSTLFTKGASGVFTQGTSEVIVASASGSPSLLSGGTTFHRLTINSTATLINAGAIITMSNANAANRLYVQQGTLSDNGSQIVGTSNGTIRVDAGAALCLGVIGATNATCNNATGATSTAFPTNYTNANITLDPASTVYYNCNASQSISATPTYGNLSIIGTITGGRTYTFTGATTINGNLTINPIGSGGTFTVTVNLGGTTTVATGKTTLVQGSGATAVVTFDTTVANHAFSTGSLDIEANGTVQARSSTITVANNWTNNGTFTQNLSTVLLNTGNTATVTGATTFYRLTITHTDAKEVDFATTGNFIISNTFTATGHAEKLIKLHSVSDGVPWNFKAQGTTSASYVDVKDSACIVGSNIVTTMLSTDGGNNGICWGFTPFVSLSLSDNTIGFGTLSSIAARYATGDGLGSFTETEAHQVSVATNGVNGHSLLIRGDSLSYGLSTITPIGPLSMVSAPGTLQFGIRAEVSSGGSGGIASLYGDTGFGYDADANITSVLASQSPSDSMTTVYSVRYLANIAASTPAGNYASNITYILVPNF